MEWYKLYEENKEPSLKDVQKYIDNSLWDNINVFLQETYNIEPSVAYSGCSAQTGWNIKYKKSSKSLCTLYPMEGFFIALVVIGNKEIGETELLMPMCTGYIQDLYNKTPFSCGGKWLMVNVTDNNILEDVKNLIKIRVKPKVK